MSNAAVKKITLKRLSIANGTDISRQPIYKLTDEPEITLVADGVEVVVKMVAVAQRVYRFENRYYVEVADASHH